MNVLRELTRSLAILTSNSIVTIGSDKLVLSEKDISLVGLPQYTGEEVICCEENQRTPALCVK